MKNDTQLSLSVQLNIVLGAQGTFTDYAIIVLEHEKWSAHLSLRNMLKLIIF